MNRLFLSIQGPLSYFERENLEKALVQLIPGIKELQKRYISAHKMTYEIRYGQPLEKLKKQIKNIPNYKIKVVAQNRQQLEIYAKKLKK